jgi:hypothetical protein
MPITHKVILKQVDPIHVLTGRSVRILRSLAFLAWGVSDQFDINESDTTSACDVPIAQKNLLVW